MYLKFGVMKGARKAGFFRRKMGRLKTSSENVLERHTNVRVLWQTWQGKMNDLKVYFTLKIGIFLLLLCQSIGMYTLAIKNLLYI